MPTFITDAPLPPDQTRSLDSALAFGKQQWQTTWRTWARQWTQPALIKLAVETLGCRALHSSQISGFQNGALRDPSPKLLLAVGLLNEAIARSNGHLQTEGLKCPGVRPELWQGKEHLRNPDGSVMGPVDVFSAVAGLIDLGIDATRQISPEAEERVSKAVGKYLRQTLSRSGVDWLEELPGLSEDCPVLGLLLMGKTVHGDQLVKELPALAEAADCSTDELWSLAVVPALQLPQ